MWIRDVPQLVHYRRQLWTWAGDSTVPNHGDDLLAQYLDVTYILFCFHCLFLLIFMHLFPFQAFGLFGDNRTFITVSSLDIFKS